MTLGGPWPGLTRQNRDAQTSENIPAVTQKGRQTPQVIPKGNPLGSPEGGAGLASSVGVMGRGARGGQGVYSIAFFWVTSVIKG